MKMLILVKIENKSILNGDFDACIPSFYYFSKNYMRYYMEQHIFSGSHTFTGNFGEVKTAGIYKIVLVMTYLLH